MDSRSPPDKAEQVAKLTTKERKDMSRSEFALPAQKGKKGKQKSDENKAGRGAYPIPNKSHAEAAVRDSKHAENVGNITSGQRKEILRKVHAKYPDVKISGMSRPGGSKKDGESKRERGDRLDKWAKGK